MFDDENLNNNHINLSETQQEEMKKNLAHYRNVLQYLGGNIPLQALCLPKVIENALVRDGCKRVYDLFSRDLGKIKGIGGERLDILTARLDEFFTIGI